jgi:hypothetical protein
MIDTEGRRLPVLRDEYFGVQRQAELASEQWLDLMQAMMARAARLLLRLSQTPIGWWSTLITLCVALLAPLAVVDVPPLLDYPNHLARAYVLAHGQQDAQLSQMYAPHWW